MKETRLYLKFPGLEDKQDVMEFKKEFLLSEQKMAGVGGLDRIDTFEEWLEKVQKDTDANLCGEGRVPSTLYLAYRKEDNKLVGMLQIRHELNNFLLLRGGHIGDCIRPSEQGKGYATEQIGLALIKCLELDIDKVLLTCNKKNIASAKTIQKNLGILENEIIDNGETIQRYWIKINKK